MEGLPREAIKLLVKEKFLEIDQEGVEKFEQEKWNLHDIVKEFYDNFKIQYNEWWGYDISSKIGSSESIRVPFEISDKLREGGDLIISKELSAKLYNICKYDDGDRRKLREFGFYTTDKHINFITNSAIVASSEIDSDKLDDEVIRFFNNKENLKDRRKCRLRRRDLKKRDTKKKGQRTKKHYTWKWGGSPIGIDSYQKEVKEDETIFKKRKGKTYKKRIYEVQSHERYITRLDHLYKAAKYVIANVKKAGFFRTHDPFIQEPITIILSYIQSRHDRRLMIDLDEMLSLRNPTINYRLSKWEQKTNKGISSITDLLNGEFYDYKRTKKNGEGKKRRIVSHGARTRRINVSRGYYYDPDKYVMDQTGLYNAVKDVLNGKKDLRDFNILDPKTETILEYCIELRQSGIRKITKKKIEDIVNLRSPSLRKILEENNLLYYHPNQLFVYRTSARVKRV